MFFPSFLSTVIVSYFVFTLLNQNTGFVDHLLVQMHLMPVDWYSSPQYWPVILVQVSLWQGAGAGSLFYLAAIVAISPEYFEAARIDGANKLQQMRYITLPLLQPVVITLVLLAIGHILSADFGLFYVVTRNQPVLYPTTDVIDTFVFRSLINLGDVGMASAAGLYQSVFGFVLVLIVNGVVRRIDRSKALF